MARTSKSAKKPATRKAAKKKTAKKKVVGKTGKITFQVWVGTGDRIRLFSVGAKAKIMTTIAPGRDSERSHPHLYRQLKGYLKGRGRWPESS